MSQETLEQKLANNLRKRRGQRTQGEYAKRLGISRPTLNRLESAGQNTTLKTLNILVKSLKCDIGELFTEDPEQG